MTDLRQRATLAALALLLVIGLSLRMYHLGSAPRPLQTADEYAWTWAGTSLLRTGVPQSWSYLNAYPGGRDVTFLGQRFTIVSPWLDHPPVFAVVMGAWALGTGNANPYTMSSTTLRMLPIIFWIVTFTLLVLVLARTLEPPTVLVAMAVFTLAPPMILQSKLVVAENLLVPLLLLAYLSVEHYVEHGRKPSLFVVAGCALLLPLIKVAALSLAAFLLVVAVRRRKPALAAVVIGATLSGLALYLAYGAHYGLAQFRSVQEAQAGRFVGFHSGLILLISTHIVNEGVLYPLFLLATVTMVIDSVEGHFADLYLLALVYVACMTFFADQRSVYGWYWLPLYPALAVGAASFIVRMWRSERALYHSLWAVVMLPWVFDPAVELGFEHRQTTRVVYLGVLAAIAAIILMQRQHRRVVLRAMTTVFVILEIAADLFVVVRR